MDITFTCKCGQEIVIDEAGAGITIDCPGCGKPAFVPTKELARAKDIPVRVETPLAKLMAKQGQTPRLKGPLPSLAAFTPHKREDAHPSIQGGLTCLVILAALFFVGISALENDFYAIGMIPYVAAPLVAGVTLSAIYAICHIGQVKYGILLLVGVTLLIALFCWMGKQALFRGMGLRMDQQMQQMQQQMQQLQKQLPQFPR